MDNAEFWKLLDDGVISPKIYSGTGEDGAEKEIAAFEYDGMYYLRINSTLRYKLDRMAECRKIYKMCDHRSYFKSFNDKTYANNYFKKVAAGLKKVM